VTQSHNQSINRRERKGRRGKAAEENQKSEPTTKVDTKGREEPKIRGKYAEVKACNLLPADESH
jgi:hypothetical protein